MRLKQKILWMVLLLLFTGSARAEYIDCRNSRLDYARSVSSFSQSCKDAKALYASGEQSGQKQDTLVLFRMISGMPEFGECEPDVLISGPHGCFTAVYGDQEAARSAIAYLQGLPGVVYAEEDGEVFAVSEEEKAQRDVPVEQNEYEFHSSGAAEMGFQEAVTWCKGVGVGNVNVAVIDSGVYPHSFISPRLVTGGFDYVDSDEDATNDVYGHGTHVAGIIVDCTPDLPVRIRPIRVLDASGRGSIANTISAVYEAAEAGCGVINMSLVSRDHSEAMEDAIRYALGHGSTVVISAGNSGDLTSRYCPVHMEESGLIVVGSCSGTLETPVRAAYSNYGPSLDVYAFGTSICSCSLSGGYTVQTGTSQAAPHVSALCAIMKRLFPGMGVGQTEARVKILAGDGEVNVPDASLLVPETMGITAQRIFLPAGTRIRLLQNAEPLTSFVNLTWSCDDETVADVDESGVLRCLSEGVTVLRGDGPAAADVSAELHVIENAASFSIPQSVTEIEDEAFHGTSLRIGYLPSGLQHTGEAVFGQSGLQTVFYEGNVMHSGLLPEDLSDFCAVIKNGSAVWKELNAAGIPYLIDCGE